MIKADNIVIGYNGVKVAGPFSFSYPDGCCVMLCGPNGCGKSTLMRTLAGQIKPIGGDYEASGKVILLPARLPRVKGFSVSEFLRLSAEPSIEPAWGLIRKCSAKTGESIQGALTLLNLKNISDKDISCISDGEFQKACIAAALIRNASVILLDEPTAFLDVDNRIMVLETLQRLAHETGTAIIFSTHDIYDGERFADKVLKLGDFLNVDLKADRNSIPERRQ